MAKKGSPADKTADWAFVFYASDERLTARFCLNSVHRLHAHLPAFTAARPVPLMADQIRYSVHERPRDSLAKTLSVAIRRDVRIVFILGVLPTIVTYGGSL